MLSMTVQSMQLNWSLISNWFWHITNSSVSYSSERQTVQDELYHISTWAKTNNSHLNTSKSRCKQFVPLVWSQEWKELLLWRFWESWWGAISVQCFISQIHWVYAPDPFTPSVSLERMDFHQLHFTRLLEQPLWSDSNTDRQLGGALQGKRTGTGLKDS